MMLSSSLSCGIAAFLIVDFDVVIAVVPSLILRGRTLRVPTMCSISNSVLSTIVSMEMNSPMGFFRYNRFNASDVVLCKTNLAGS